ncbi:hypothetical protein BH20VER2_BH20VER2_01840 [soil metagenome]
MTNPLDQFRDQVSIVVSSYDGFFDAWRPFAFFFRKFWSSCPFPVYLITNELEVRSTSLRQIRVGRDRGWASNMQTALEQISTSHLLYLQEDYFLTRPVDEVQLASDFTFALENDAASFCFFDLALLGHEFTPRNGRFDLVPVESKGRTRLQTTLWKRDTLRSLLRPGEDAWQMEARGSDRTRDLRMFSYGPNELSPIPYLMSGLVRGLWTKEALAHCRAHGFSLRPRVRLQFRPGKVQQRWRRAVGRVTLPIMRSLQGGVIDLDAPASVWPPQY